MHEHVDSFLAYMSGERQKSDNTTAAYRTDLDQLCAFLNERQVADVQSVTHDDMLAFMLFLHERSYAASTVARRTAAVKSFFGYLATQHVITHDPTSQIDSPKVDRSIPKAISQHQMDELLELPLQSRSPEGLRDKAMLELLYATGMRVSELVDLNTADIVLDANTVRCIGKAGRERILPLTPTAATAIEEYLDLARSQIARSADKDCGGLFLNHRGKRLTRQGFWLILKGYADQVGLHDLTPHTLRHSFAAHMLDGGAELREVQERLGHVSLSTTQIYAHMPEPPPARPRSSDNDNEPGVFDDLLVEADVKIADSR